MTDVIASQASPEPEDAGGDNPSAPTLSGPIVGIIYPPPEVRNIVDKTASFVARNGPEFESRIRQNELGNPKFNFLSAGDPYHAYYQHKVREIREGRNDVSTAVVPSGIQQLKSAASAAAQLKQQELLKAVREEQFVPKDAPAEFEFIADPPSISALDLDIVKLTAQFVARNGRLFLTNLMNREQRNYQFDFLRPQHSLFQYFTKLLEQYTKILVPPKDLMNKLKIESTSGRSSMNVVLEQVKYRANWNKHQEMQRRREEEKVERERVAYAQIDWHDFVVVEVVDYQPYESGNFPPPTTPDEVGARVLMEERLNEEDHDIEMQIESDDEESDDDRPSGNVKLSKMENRIGQGSRRDNNQVQDMDESSSSSDDDESERPGRGKAVPPAPLPPPIAPPTHDKVIVKKYDPKQAQKIQKPPAPVGDDYLISPITGEKIPASKVSEHMRIGLLDPRWVEQRDKHIEKVAQENVYAPGAAIEASLKQLAERRTDIFGVGDEEAAIGKKLGEEETKKDDRVTWDGHTSSVEAATRAARANITLEAQIHQIHKSKGLITDEEKEKIGPKPIPGTVALAPPKPPSQQSQQHQQSSQQHAPPPPKPIQHQQPQQHHQQPPVPMMMQMGMGMGPPPMMPPPFNVGFGVPPMPPHPSMAQNPNHPDQQQQPPSNIDLDAEPPNKKSREDHLIEESVFMQRHKGPVTIQVQCPNLTEKSEWKLSGQTISMQLQLTDSVTVMKGKLQAETGMPPAKQKIFYEGMFFKDSNTVAYYNLLSGATVHLQLKERGGRKK
ncbi:splicing factor 3A subunit 1 [Culex pipiens pallens]|uniref:splicing factor 3A subunit 1 n=1 Tax=Culex pipiens pallens TaxID=42434 RepID=UPI001952DC62|nr:splicing factor 3A subunit 1 [Culex pipiens pallens]XP_039430033.1 splicing factor 3A subunit 1 [Culex pipiens pallens]